MICFVICCKCNTFLEIWVWIDKLILSTSGFCCHDGKATWCQVSIVLHAAAQLAFQGRQELFEKLLESPAWELRDVFNITSTRWFFGRYLSFFLLKGTPKSFIAWFKNSVFFFASSAFVVASPGTSGSGKAIFRRGIWRSASMLRPRCVSWGVTKPWWYTRQKLTAGYPKNWWGSLEKASLAENMSMFWYLCQISEGYFAVYRGWLYYPVIYIRDHNEPLLGSLLTKQIMECHRGFERCSIWGLPKPCDSGWSIHFYEGAPLLTFTINWYSV